MSKSLQELSNIHYGKSPNEVRVTESPFPVYGTGGAFGFASEPIFDGPLVVVARKGTLTSPSYVPNPCWVIDTAYAVIAKEDVNAKWLYYQIANFDLSSLNEATGVPSISRDYLYRVSFVDTDPNEQKKIARILTTLDNLIEKTEALIAKYQAIKQGVMHDLFTRGVDEHGQLRPAQQQAPDLYKQSELGWIPKDWDDPTTLGAISHFDSGYAFKNQELTEFGWKIVRITNLHRPNFPYWRFGGKPKDSWIVRKGDLLFSWAGVASSIDAYLYRGEDALLNQHIYNIRIEPEQLRQFVFHWLQFILPRLRSEIEGGAGQLHLTKGKIQNIGVALPCPEELPELLRRITSIENRISSEEEYRAKLLLTKTGLMQDLLTGKVRAKVDEVDEVDAHA